MAGKQWLSPIAILAWIFGVFAAPNAVAFTVDQNYFAPADPGLLGSAEIHHLQQGIDKMTAETRQGQYPFNGAMGEFRYILTYFPNHPRALALASELSIRARHPEWVEPYFEKSLTLYPNYASTRVIYGTFLQKLGKSKDAILQYELALQIDPGFMTAHYNLGLAYLEQRKLDMANRHAQIAYKGGAQLSGLRDKLKQAGAWKDLADPAAGPKSN